MSHRDLDLAIEPTAKPLASGSRADVAAAMAAIHQVLNLIYERRFRTTLSDDIIGPNAGAEALLYVLRDGIEADQARRKRLESGEFTPEDRLRHSLYMVTAGDNHQVAALQRIDEPVFVINPPRTIAR